MRDDSYCNILCQKKYNKKDAEEFKKAIVEEYHHNWIIDNLPAASVSGNVLSPLRSQRPVQGLI